MVESILENAEPDDKEKILDNIQRKIDKLAEKKLEDVK